MRPISGLTVEHWIDRRIRENKSISCPSNYIRIPAAAHIKFQEFRNKWAGKKEPLIEAHRRWEEKQRNGEMA